MHLRQPQQQQQQVGGRCQVHHSLVRPPTPPQGQQQQHCRGLVGHLQREAPALRVAQVVGLVVALQQQMLARRGPAAPHLALTSSSTVQGSRWQQLSGD
jgi:hypothetical protein